MGKLSQKTIEHLATYMKSATPYARTQIKFKFTTRDAGQEAYDMLMEDYSDVCDKQYGEATPKIFRLGFVDADTRLKVLEEIKDAVAKYNISDGDTTKSKLASWGLYLAIGVAAIVIIIALWRKFKA